MWRSAQSACGRLSPITRSAAYFVVYVICATGLSLLLYGLDERKKGATDPKFPYNPAAIVLLVEVIKLVLASAYYLNWRDEHSTEEKVSNLFRYKWLALLYLAPAFFYSAYNVLMFYAIVLVGPASFRVLINFRLVFTGVFLRYFSLLHLSLRQWSALAAIVAACVLEQSGHYNPASGALLGVAFVLIMAWCAAMPAVINQLLIHKRPSHELGGRFVWQSNVYIYAWSVLLQLTFLYVADRSSLSLRTLLSFDARVWGIVGLATCVGITSAFILADTSLHVREYANYIDMLLTITLNRLLFGAGLHASTFAALLLVSVALYAYYHSSSGNWVVAHTPQCAPLTALPATTLTPLYLPAPMHRNRRNSAAAAASAANTAASPASPPLGPITIGSGSGSGSGNGSGSGVDGSGSGSGSGSGNGASLIAEIPLLQTVPLTGGVSGSGGDIGTAANAVGESDTSRLVITNTNSSAAAAASIGVGDISPPLTPSISFASDSAVPPLPTNLDSPVVSAYTSAQRTLLPPPNR